MAANEYEPSAEQVRALQAEFQREKPRPYDYFDEGEARFIIRRQHERESAILAAVQNVIPPDPFFARPSPERDKGFYDGTCLAASAVKDAIRKLDAKPEPTLRDAARAIFNAPLQDGPCVMVPKALTDALKAAVEREERGK